MRYCKPLWCFYHGNPSFYCHILQRGIFIPAKMQYVSGTITILADRVLSVARIMTLSVLHDQRRKYCHRAITGQDSQAQARTSRETRADPSNFAEPPIRSMFRIEFARYETKTSSISSREIRSLRSFYGRTTSGYQSTHWKKVRSPGIGTPGLFLLANSRPLSYRG